LTKLSQALFLAILADQNQGSFWACQKLPSVNTANLILWERRVGFANESDTSHPDGYFEVAEELSQPLLGAPIPPRTDDAHDERMIFLMDMIFYPRFVYLSISI
jgi:hypothetical protein